jgi:hypothetical protein
MFNAKRLTAVAAVIGVAAVGAPVAGASAAGPLPGLGQPLVAPGNSSADVCLSNVVDPGPFGPSGPYGADGPWGPNGPMHGSANPLGNVTGCGGALAFLLRGGTVASYVQANLAAVGR